MEAIQPNQIYLMDCREGMRLMPNSCVDLIVTDPPFAIEFGAKRSNYNRTAARVLEGYNEIPQQEYMEVSVWCLHKAPVRNLSLSLPLCLQRRFQKAILSRKQVPCGRKGL
jgi:DNA modification methylase